MINKPLVSLIKVEVLGSNPTIVIGGMSYGAGPYKWPIIMGKWGEITVFIGVLSYNYITLLLTIIWAHLVVNHL